MTLEITFRRFGLLSDFIPRTASLIQTGNGESRNAHWLGRTGKQTTPPQQDTPPGGQQDPPPQPDPRGYRDLASIRLGEVEDAYSYLQSQLVASPSEGWIAKNYFCQIPLQRQGTPRPPVIFGRVKSMYPASGYIQNVEMMEMYFPRAGGEPDRLHIEDRDIAQNRRAQSYCVGVKFYVSAAEMQDFAPSENIFLEKGFAPLYETGYLDLLEVNEQNHASLPWLHVIGSEWFASIPDTVQPEIREQLRNVVRRGTRVFNYHPRRHALRHLSLNEELDFHYGFSEQYLVTPQNTEQVLTKVQESFDEIFLHGGRD